MTRLDPDEGAVSAVLLALLILVAFSCLAVVDAAGILVARARAQTAADAGALAAAAAQWPLLSGGPDAEEEARAIVEANRATLESCDCPVRGTQAVVVVRVPVSPRLLRGPSSVRARAGASLDPGGVFRPP